MEPIPLDPFVFKDASFHVASSLPADVLTNGGLVFHRLSGILCTRAMPLRPGAARKGLVAVTRVRLLDPRRLGDESSVIGYLTCQELD